MDVNTVAQTNAVVAASNATSNGFDDLSSEDFFALMIAELQAQDPLEPKDNEALLSQMSSIRQMEQSASLTQTLEAQTEALEAIVGGSRFNNPSSLIGMYVAGTATGPAGEIVEMQGIVKEVRYDAQGNAALLLHDDQILSIERLEQVTLVENLPIDLQIELGILDPSNLPTDDAAPEEEPPAEGDSTNPGETNARLRIGIRSGSDGSPSGERVDVVAELLDSLFSPGLHIGVGS